MHVQSVAPELWPDLETLFGKAGASNGCWCMYWCVGATYHRRPREENRTALRNQIAGDPPPGLLAFDGEKPVGWCRLYPRSSLPWLEKAPWFVRVDDSPVWSIPCFYVHHRHRRQGLMSELIEAALHTARIAGAPAVEAYPIDTTIAGSTRNTFPGVASAFIRAGFQEVARHAAARPILRYSLVQ